MRPVTPVGILASSLEQLVRKAEDIEHLDSVFKAELQYAYDLAHGLDPYITRCTTPESTDLANLVRRTQTEDWQQHFSNGETARPLEQEMLSGHVEGQMLKFLVHLTRAHRILEIGMFTGYSALAMAEALPDDGEVVACEVDAFAAKFAQQCFNDTSVGHKISIFVAPAIDTMRDLAATGKIFDLVFIDADKAGYIDYLDLLLDSGLLAPNGLICADNTLMQGQPYLSGVTTPNGESIALFNQRLIDDSRVEQVLLPLRDGLTLIRRI
jgi:caffeoyl-CoA O-methyltransferase